MRFLSLIFIVLLLPTFLLAQTLSMGKKQATHAVVIGVSDYQDAAIPDLQFAHKDAIAFVDFLQSEAGESLADDDMIVLLNEEATTARIAAALDWLIEQTKEGDKAYIYFSGHGDVETNTAMQHGFLLTYDSPPTTYIAGAYPLFYLQSVITTLSTQKKGEVIIITDACRSGKLAGSSIGGTQATTAALSKQFANEIKVLSCQPDEYSLEGEQWGGGRGVFSYHLIDALSGFADQDGDLRVNLLELGRYLEDKVPTEVAPESQIPMVMGNRATQIATVDEATLARLKTQKDMESPMIARVETKGLEEEVLANVDEALRAKYQAFKSAVEKGILLGGPQESANELYEELIKEDRLQRLHSLMRRNLAVAFQEEAQQAVNAYLKADSTEMMQLYRQDEKYHRFPLYLARAGELLGESHYMYPSLKSMEHYFAGLIIRLGFEKENAQGALLEEAFQHQESALAYQGNSPVVHNELGILYFRKGEKRDALRHFQKAIALAPYWLVPQSMLIKTYMDLKEYDKAIRCGERTQVIEQDFPGVSPTVLNEIVIELGVAYAYQKEYGKAERQFQQLLTQDRHSFAALVGLGWIAWARSQWEVAKGYLESAIAIQPNDPEALVMLGDVYFFTGKFEESEASYRKVLNDNPADVQAIAKICFLYLHWSKKKNEATRELGRARKLLGPNPNLDVVQAFIYRNSGEYEAALNLIGKVVEEEAVMPRIMPQALTLLGYVLLDLKQYQPAERVFLQTHAMGEEHYWPMYCLSRLYAGQNKREQALDWLERSLEHGGPWHQKIQEDPYLRRLKREERFIALMARYFPE